MKEQHTQKQTQRGFTLLIAILVVGVVLAVGLSILTITLKEYLLSGMERESVIALNAADAGMECALYWDRSSQGGKFDGAGGGSITCVGITINPVPPAPQGTAQNFDFSWPQPNPTVCSKITVTKFATGETKITSLGYNKPCATTMNSPRTVERGLETHY